MTTAAERWDGIYADASGPGGPADFVLANADRLPASGTAADLAGGTGGTALWLAERGLDTTLVEVSERAAEVAASVARERGVALRTLLHDLEGDDPLAASWDVVVVSNFLHRPLLARLAEHVRPGGLALVRIATVRNLEQNEHPSRRFLVDENELPDLCAGLEVVSHEERWFADRHEARVIARRPLS